jgi:pyruvate,orthophosphate dikinase
MTKWVYQFGNGEAEGNATLKTLLGGKGANLGEMSGMGLPVPPGFTITTEVCTYYYAHERSYPTNLKQAVGQAMTDVGGLSNGVFGDPARPLLVSVRSGARV